MPTPPPRRRCTELKKDGSQCNMWALYLWLIDGEEQQWCRTHVNRSAREGSSVETIKKLAESQ